MVELNQQLTMSQLIPQAAREQERTQLLKKVVKDFKGVCDSMDSVRKDTAQHVKDICRMKLEVSQMRGKAALESHEAVSLWDMIQKDQDAINRLIKVVKEVKNYTDTLGQIEVLRERLGQWISISASCRCSRRLMCWRISWRGWRTGCRISTKRL